MGPYLRVYPPPRLFGRLEPPRAGTLGALDSLPPNILGDLD